MTSSSPQSIPDGFLWCTAHRMFHPEDAFAWKHKDLGIRQSRCRQAQKVSARASYRKRRSGSGADVAARREALRADQAEQLRNLLADRCCVDCGSQGKSGLLASMPNGWATPAQAVRSRLAGVDFAELVSLAVWRCRSCAGRRTPSRPTPQRTELPRDSERPWWELTEVRVGGLTPVPKFVDRVHYRRCNG